MADHPIRLSSLRTLRGLGNPAVPWCPLGSANTPAAGSVSRITPNLSGVFLPVGLFVELPGDQPVMKDPVGIVRPSGSPGFPRRQFPDPAAVRVLEPVRLSCSFRWLTGRRDPGVAAPWMVNRSCLDVVRVGVIHPRHAVSPKVAGDQPAHALTITGLPTGGA